MTAVPISLQPFFGLSFATPRQVGDLPGVIVMALQDGGGTAAPELETLDPHTEQIVVVFNARCATPDRTVPVERTLSRLRPHSSDFGCAGVAGLMPPI